MGWPSFSEAHGTSGSDESNTGILRRADTSLGLARTEVVCKQVGVFASCVLFSPAPPECSAELTCPCTSGVMDGSAFVMEALWVSPELLPVPLSHHSQHCRPKKEPCLVLALQRWE